MSGISLRQFHAPDWKEFRHIRLKALENSPGVFSATHDDWAERADAEWQNSVSNPDTAIFGIYDEEKLIGLTAISIDRHDLEKKNAIMWASWLEPEYRGKGISKQMYEARIEWARRHPTCEKIIVGHRASNLASKHANQKHGFVLTGIEKEQRWPDGTTEDSYDYELNISERKLTT